MHKKIIIVDDINFIRNNLDKIKEIQKQENAPIIPLSDAAYLFLRGEGVEALSYHDFEDKDMYGDIYPTAREWGMNWYKPDGSDLTETNSYSLGFLYEWIMIHFLVHCLRVYLSLSAVVRKTSPLDITIITAEKVDLLSNIPAWKHLDISMLPDMVNLCIKNQESHIKLKIINLEYITPKQRNQRLMKFIRSIIVQTNSLVSGILGYVGSLSVSKKKIAFFEGYHHFEGIMKDPLLKDFEKIHIQKIIGPRLLLGLYSNGIRIESLRRHGKQRYSPALSFDLEKIKLELSGFFVYQGNDLLPVIWLRLEFLFKEFFPAYMYPDLLSTISVMKKVSCDCLITENDNTYNEKMLVVVAKKLGIRSIVIQNGATWIGNSYKDRCLSIHDFYPLISDLFFAYGKVTKDWYENMKVDCRKVVVTGASRFDKYYISARKRGGENGKKTVLVLLNDFGFHEGIVTQDMPLGIVQRHVSEFVRIARNNPEINFIVRPHSDNYLLNRIFRAEAGDLRNFVITRKNALSEILPIVDLVIGYASTALIESLIFRIPVISFNAGGYCNPFPLWDYSLSKQVSSFEDLEPAIKSLLFDKKQRGAFVESIDRNIYLFNYNDDGLASRRIAGKISEILT